MNSKDTHAVKRFTTGPLPVSEAKGQADRVESILASHQRNGGQDMTVREICRAYERVYGGQLFPNHAEGRLGNLEAANRVFCDRENKRACSVTQVLAKVYSLPLVQARLV